MQQSTDHRAYTSTITITQLRQTRARWHVAQPAQTSDPAERILCTATDQALETRQLGDPRQTDSQVRHYMSWPDPSSWNRNCQPQSTLNEGFEIRLRPMTSDDSCMVCANLLPIIHSQLHTGHPCFFASTITHSSKTQRASRFARHWKAAIRLLEQARAVSSRDGMQQNPIVMAVFLLGTITSSTVAPAQQVFTSQEYAPFARAMARSYAQADE